MTQPGAEDDSRTRREDQQNQDAADGDGLARAAQGKQTGEGLEGSEDTADGEDATSS